jgi:hypothetical protein
VSAGTLRFISGTPYGEHQIGFNCDDDLKQSRGVFRSLQNVGGEKREAVWALGSAEKLSASTAASGK